ncbi:hypothetical protein [Paenibacillus terrae]|nr:hypothetical protein [Paenibacillus terrae]
MSVCPRYFPILSKLAREKRLEAAQEKLAALQSAYQATCRELERYIRQ